MIHVVRVYALMKPAVCVSSVAACVTGKSIARLIFF